VLLFVLRVLVLERCRLLLLPLPLVVDRLHIVMIRPASSGDGSSAPSC
jgi:hypothetical protein